MLKSILQFMARVFIFLTKNLGRLALVVLYVGAGGLGWVFDQLQSVAFYACVRTGTFKPVEFDQVEAPEFEPKFSQEQVQKMASDLHGQAMTIQEIQDELGLSYRQARKVKQAIDASLPVFQGSQKLAAV